MRPPETDGPGEPLAGSLPGDQRRRLDGSSRPRTGQVHPTRLLVDILLRKGIRAGFEGMGHVLNDAEFRELATVVDCQRVERHHRDVRLGEHVLEGVCGG